MVPRWHHGVVTTHHAVIVHALCAPGALHHDTGSLTEFMSMQKNGSFSTEFCMLLLCNIMWHRVGDFSCSCEVLLSSVRGPLLHQQAAADADTSIGRF